MAQTSWQRFEDKVRTVASLIFGKECTPSRICGVNFDGVIEVDPLETVAIEISEQNELDKVRQGIIRLTLARQQLNQSGILLRGFIILSRPPTKSMIDAIVDSKFIVSSLENFSNLFFNFGQYQKARTLSTFGSSIDPITGEIDTVRYIPVRYNQIGSSIDLDVSDIADLLAGHTNVVLLGEYGSGKSRCVRELFRILSDRAYTELRYPLAINLRECWGLDHADELIRRSLYTLGLDELASSAVRALNRGRLLLLLDGFDELGSQSWSAEENRLRQLRSRALAGVRDAISKAKCGCLIAGREHYFSSNEEMLSALGLTKTNTIFVKAKDEFSADEIDQYFDATNLDVDIPSWLPRRPLICQTIANLSSDELSYMFGNTSDGVEFWNHFIQVLCKRDARINVFFDADTIYEVFVALSRLTRTRPANVGPISQRDLQDAFESVVGQLPVEEASAMLQRLPSLGRIGAESQDRQFVDMFILDGLRSKDVSGLLDADDIARQEVFREKWINPLGSLGQSILSHDISAHTDGFRQIAIRSSKERNSTLSADILSSLSLLDVDIIDLNGIIINDAVFGDLNLFNSRLANFSIEYSTFERLILPNSPPRGASISHSIASNVSGASSFSGLPSWVQLDLVDQFDTIENVSQIRRIGLSPAHEILVAILRKTFKQKGSGRKEEALLRGLGSGISRKTGNYILNLLMRESILDRHKGDEGWIYSPQRKYTSRVDSILEQLRSSSDPLWSEVRHYDE